MKFISQISRFSSYLNGETPYVKNGNWWIGDTDTGVAAQAVDGVSFSGIVEYYFATLATEVDVDGTPIAPDWNKATWFTKIQDTKFGTKDIDSVTYKYLWNVEVVKSTNADGKVSETVSDVELFLTHNDSRIPAEYISYYAASVTSVAPQGYPILGENNNFISGPENAVWKKEDEYTGSADESAFLFEISFVKYAEKDEKGHNLYALLSGPSMIGHNGANGKKGDNAVTYSLSVIPNSWNKTVSSNISPSFVVTQHVGNEIVEMQSGYIIKVGGVIWDNESIAEDTTFDLYVNDVLVDSETVTAIQDGADGTGINVKASESACVAIGDGYIDADGNLIILTSLSPREFTNGGQIRGPKGDTTFFHTAYANSADGTLDFSVTDYANKEFIGHYTDTIEADSTNPSDYKWSKMKGDQGRGISFMVNYYLASANASGITHNTSGWQQPIPDTDQDKPYLWNYELIVYSSGEPAMEMTDPRMIGSVGIDGDDGRGISSITEEYYAWAIGVTPEEYYPWNDTIPTLTTEAPCLWCKETINYTTGSPEVFIRLVAQRGQDGMKGHDGSTGTQTEAVRIFAYNTINSAPTLTNSTPIGSPAIGISPGIWTTDEITADYTYKFVFTSTGVKTTTYSGTVAQPSTYSGWTTPELWSAYHVNVGGKEYATFLKLTNNGTAQGLKYDNGELYINASYINTGTLTVGASSSPTFSADVSSGTVSIAGWMVSRLYGICGNSYKVGMVDPIAGSANFSRTSLISGSSKIVFYAGSFDPTGSNYTKIPEFTVLADGSLYATAAKISGNITATSGTIAGFTIGPFNFSTGPARQSMYYGVTQNAATIAANQMVICPQGAYLSKFSTGTSEGNRFVMLIGTNFGITQSGKLYTTSAKIGNFELSDGYLNAAGGEYGVIRAARIDSALDGGSIVSIGAGQLKVGWVVKNIGTAYNYSGDWMALSQDTSVWGGLCGGDISTMTASSVSAALNTFANRTMTRETIGWRFTGTSWLTYDVDCGRSIWIQSDWGTNNECSIKLGDLNSSGISRGHVDIWANGTYLSMHGDDNAVSGRELNSVYIGGSAKSINLYLNGNLLHSSWSKKKTNISRINEQYDTFFDNLVPKKYFYNIYAENAYHLGFVFEEVGESLTRAGLQKEDFCGYSLTDPVTGEGHLAYTEFIALNTWQIQKLKPRMTAAEQEIEKLKLEIAQLREELKNLQNS